MKITTGTAEIGLVVRSDGGYELAMYRRATNSLVRFPVDAALAWAISGALHTPITTEAMAPAK